MLMDNTLELLGITDSNIKITRFSAESVNGEKRNVIEHGWPTMWTDAPTANLKRSSGTDLRYCTRALRSFTRNALK